MTYGHDDSPINIVMGIIIIIIPGLNPRQLAFKIWGCI